MLTLENPVKGLLGRSSGQGLLLVRLQKEVVSVEAVTEVIKEV